MTATYDPHGRTATLEVAVPRSAKTVSEGRWCPDVHRARSAGLWFSECVATESPRGSAAPDVGARPHRLANPCDSTDLTSSAFV